VITGLAVQVAGQPYLRDEAQEVVAITSTTRAKAANKVFIFIVGYFNQE
jgi:hypothetical protein